MKKMVSFIVAGICAIILIFLFSNVQLGIVQKPAEKLKLTYGGEDFSWDDFSTRFPKLHVLDREEGIVGFSYDEVGLKGYTPLQNMRRLMGQIYGYPGIYKIQTFPEVPGFSWEQYGQGMLTALKGYAKGDFGIVIGKTSQTQKPLVNEIGPMFGRTLPYFLSALFAAFTLGIALALLATMIKRFGRFLDGVHKSLMALPDFLVITIVITFAIFISKFTTQRLILIMQIGDEIPFLIPFVTIILLPCIMVYGTIRAALLREMSKPYIVAAMAKGLSKRAIVLRHALRNVMEDLMSVLPRATTAATGSMIIVEAGCAILGIGGYMTNPYFSSEAALPIICLQLALFALAMQVVFMLLRKRLVITTREASA